MTGMTDFLQTAYVFVWAALAIITFIIGFKHGKFGFVLSGIFVFLTVWYGIGAFTELPVFEGALGIVFRGVAIVCLLIAIAILVYERKKGGKQSGKKISGGSHDEDERDEDDYDLDDYDDDFDE